MIKKRFCKNYKKCKNEVTVTSVNATIVLCESCKKEKNPATYGKWYDDDHGVHCRNCGFRSARLAQHIKKYCKVKTYKTKEHYFEDFPDATIISKIAKSNLERSEETNKKSSISQLKSWKNKGNDILKTHKKVVCNVRGEEYYVPINSMKKNQLFICPKCKDELLEEEKKKQKLKIQQLKCMKEYVECPICLEEEDNPLFARKLFISSMHLLKHNYTMEKFKEKFPNCKLKIDSIGKEHSKNLSGENHFNYGKILGQNPKISEGIKKHYETLKDQCFHCGEFKTNIQQETGLCEACSKLDFGDYDDYDKVYCRICNTRHSILVNHLRIFHQLTKYEYLEQYPNAPLVSEKYKTTISNSRKKYFETIDKNIRQITLIPFYSSSRGPNWKEMRKLALIRDENKCQVCKKENSAKEPLHVHHKIPYSIFQGDYIKANDLKNLKTLCNKHHNKEEVKFWNELKEKEAITIDGDDVFVEFNGKIIKQSLNKDLQRKISESYEKTNQDTDDYIFCRICNLRFSTITETHLRIHGLIMSIYKQRFPNAPLTSKTFRKKSKNGNDIDFLEYKDIFKIYDINELKKNKNKNKDTDNEVFCRICGEKHENLSFHITYIHKIRIPHYKKIFKDSPILAKNSRKKDKI